MPSDEERAELRRKLRAMKQKRTGDPDSRSASLTDAAWNLCGDDPALVRVLTRTLKSQGERHGADNVGRKKKYVT